MKKKYGHLRGKKITVFYYFIIQDFFQKIHLSGSEIIKLKI